MAFIRPYRREDFDATAHICRETLPADISSSEPLHRLAPYIWTHQFTHLSQATCFVLDDGSGRAVGYCIGCPDILAFAASYPSYLTDVLDPSPEISRPGGGDVVCNDTQKQPWLVDGQFSESALAQTAYSAHWLLIDGNEDLLGDGYRATMHIDLLDEWQGKGWGRKLIDEFVQSVRNVQQADGSESRGIWIGVGDTNAKVVPFYEKLGFSVRDRPVKSQTITMVKDYY
ncbi:hypothetical protein QQS21_011149 [Conoideocrella luteorostrata]|uniref:N-acetyltransferase domain-containing protein n=1 Tax=Conoideocrella luteorostrata TaxID=1105319 RepID=A0AAJ0CDM8_9HYPO|nr:hypothetical protein QQS21_011149 [Conoideocrella luteorostrata]